MDEPLKTDILSLLFKVREVVSNNDWPTEEGQQRADDAICPLLALTNRIERSINDSC